MSVQVSVNRGAEPLVDRLVGDAAAHRVAVTTLANGSTVVDAGIACRGGIEAGRLVAEICLGGLGRVAIAQDPSAEWPARVAVHASDPVIACLGSQYAGWSLEHGEGRGAYRALGSGPARALGSSEPLFEELGYRDRHDRACLVLEVDAPPPVALAEQIAERCGVPGDGLTLVLTPTTSLAGTTQVVARVLEVALHKLHELGFPLDRVVDGHGVAPLPPPATDFLGAMGRTNDAIIFGGAVHLYLDCDDDAAADLAARLPSSASRDFGRPFAEVFKACDYDFYRIDRLLFSPARVLVTALGSGRTHRGGSLHPQLVARSFG